MTPLYTTLTGRIFQKENDYDVIIGQIMRANEEGLLEILLDVSDISISTIVTLETEGIRCTLGISRLNHHQLLWIISWNH